MSIGELDKASQVLVSTQSMVVVLVVGPLLRSIVFFLTEQSEEAANFPHPIKLKSMEPAEQMNVMFPQGARGQG